MKPLFEPEQFEKLTGMAMGRYAAQIVKEGELPADFFNYFKANANRWDGQHLEMAISLLRKIDSDAARHEMANYLNHSLKYIRLTVLIMIDQMPVIDNYILSKVQERMRAADDEFEMRMLKPIESKAGKNLTVKTIL